MVIIIDRFFVMYYTKGYETALINYLTNWDLTSRKGFGEILSPNINRGVCGEQAERQGKQSIAMLTGGDMLV